MSTDIVFIDGLQLSANVGPDCWARIRPQPVIVSVYLHLTSSYLSRAGVSDDVIDTVNYGHLGKAVSALVDTRFSSAVNLAFAVSGAAFKLAGEAAAEVRVCVELPKMILLASNFTVDVTMPAGSRSEDAHITVFVTDLTLPVIIGVNAHEREAKQRVVTHLTFRERRGHGSTVDYRTIIGQISEKAESSSYLTLEKFAFEVARVGCMASEAIDAVTVRAQKPSALSFSRFSGVEITRERNAFNILHL